MWRMTGVCSLLAALLVGLGAGCEPIGRADAVPDAVEVEALPGPGSVPAAWGRLVDVTTTPGYREDFAQLWFEDESGAIRIVYYHFRDRALDPRVERISRARPLLPEAGPEGEVEP